MRNRGFYFDIVEYENYAQKNQTPSTPATSLLYALEAQMGDIGREGIERRWERHISMRDATIEWVYGMSTRRGIEISVLAPEGARSPTVTVVKLPEGLKGPEVSRSDQSARHHRRQRLRQAQRHDDSHRTHGRSHARGHPSLPARVRVGDHGAGGAEAVRSRVIRSVLTNVSSPS